MVWGLSLLGVAVDDEVGPESVGELLVEFLFGHAPFVLGDA